MKFRLVAVGAILMLLANPNGIRAQGLIAQRAYVKASNTGARDGFGYSVAVSGNSMVVGAPFEKSGASGVNGNQNDNGVSDAGAAYIFVRNESNWVQQAYLKASNTGTQDLFGISVAVSGDTVVVGAFQEDGGTAGVNGDQSNNSVLDSGAAYVFVRNGTNWTQQAYLKSSNTDTQDLFGYSVAVSGNTLVVGAIFEASNATGVNGVQTNNNARASGAAYIFVRSGTNWSQEAYLKGANTEMFDDFGSSVAICGETVVVGALVESSSSIGVNGGGESDNSAYGAGAAYVFVRSGTNWTQQAYVKASNTEMEDHFGSSVAISGNTMVIGAWGEDSHASGVNDDQANNSGTNSGAAYVFVRAGTNWSQQAYLKASSNGLNDNFGFSVAASGNTVMVGALLEDNAGMDSGAAYVFTRSGTNWTQQAYLKASTVGVFDYFGQSVALSGDTMVAGAHQEDSNATGVNGNQVNNIAVDSGAAYVFARPSVGPPLFIASDSAGGYFIRCNGIADITYQLQRASSVTGPWATNAITTALLPGIIEFHDTNAPFGQSFYRVAQQ